MAVDETGANLVAPPQSPRARSWFNVMGTGLIVCRGVTGLVGSNLEMGGIGGMQLGGSWIGGKTLLSRAYKGGTAFSRYAPGSSKGPKKIHFEAFDKYIDEHGYKCGGPC